MGNTCEWASVVRRRIDPEMHELFRNKLINVCGFRRMASRGKIPHRRQRCVLGLGHANRFSVTIVNDLYPSPIVTRQRPAGLKQLRWLENKSGCGFGAGVVMNGCLAGVALATVALCYAVARGVSGRGMWMPWRTLPLAARFFVPIFGIWFVLRARTLKRPEVTLLLGFLVIGGTGRLVLEGVDEDGKRRISSSTVVSDCWVSR